MQVKPLNFNKYNLKTIQIVKIAMALKKSQIKKIIFPYSVGDKVLFILDGTRTLVYGTITSYNGVSNEYTIEDGNHKYHTVPHVNVFKSKEHFLSQKGLKEFDCEIFLDHCSSISKTVISETLEEAIAALKEDFPNAYSIGEADHWR